MKKLILMAILIAGISFCYSQNNGGNFQGQHKNMSSADRAAKDAQWAEQKLGLTADQKSKWEAASLERSNANEPIREKMKSSTTPQDRAQLRSQMKGNMDKFETTVNGFLTPDQKTKYAEAKSEKRSHRGKGVGRQQNMSPSGQ